MAVANLDEDIDWQLIKSLVFGNGVTSSVFDQWLQPFTFSPTEPTALVQKRGGPCAVLAPLQANIMKICVRDSIKNLSALSEETANSLLQCAMCDILTLCRPPGRSLTLARVSKEVATAWQDCKQQNNEEEEEGERGPANSNNSASKRMRCDRELVDVDTFHTCLTTETFATNTNLAKYLEDNFSSIMGTKYDVLSFLYSVVLTRGPNRIINERQDMEESLIDPVHGHGSQSLVNLLLTGVATQNVFDGTKDLCGLELDGIEKQAQIGFLSFLECLRYLEVGTNLKSPVFPVWLLGSETHLTVLFSQDKRLVKPPSQREKAILKFKTLDTESCGFVPSSQLKQLMELVELFADQEYVDIMRDKIDSSGMGIILQSQFLDEFFPDEESSCPDLFTLHHYNGLPKAGSEVKYTKGEAILLEGSVQGKADNNPMLQTLQTKWQNIAVDWDSPPSIN